MIDAILDKYKEITEEIIKNIKNDEVDIITLMNKREEIIKSLFNGENTNNEKIKALYISKGILKLDEKLKVSIEDTKGNIKKQIINLQKLKSANNAYEKNRRVNNFFSTKI